MKNITGWTAIMAVMALITTSDAVAGSFRHGYTTKGPEAILYGKEVRRTRTREAIVIDPPLPRLQEGSGKIEVLEFLVYPTHLRRDGGGRVDWKRRADEKMAAWRASLPADVTIRRVPIAPWWTNPNFTNAPLLDYWRTQERMIFVAQQLGIEQRTHEAIRQAIDDYTSALRTREQAEALFATLGVPSERFDEAWESPETLRKIALAQTMNETRSRLSRFYRAKKPSNVPPVFIINGKYLVGAYNTRKPERGFLVANTLIRRELERRNTPSAADLRWQALFDEVQALSDGEIEWGTPLEPKPGQFVELDVDPSWAGNPRSIKLEWFFPYVTRGHDPEKTTGWLSENMERLLRKWWKTNLDPATRAHVWLRPIPIAYVPGERNELDRRRGRRHQRMVLGWKLDGYRGYSQQIHRAIRARFAGRVPGHALDTQTKLSRWLKKRDVPVSEYFRAARNRDVRNRAQAINERIKAVFEQAQQSDKGALRAPRHPILLINRKYLVQGSTAGGFHNALRITEWMLRTELATIACRARGSTNCGNAPTPSAK